MTKGADDLWTTRDVPATFEVYAPEVDGDSRSAKQVAADLVEEVMKGLGIEEVDESALEDLCRRLLAANPKIVAKVKGGKVKAIGALIGQAKKENPNVNPGQVREICLGLIEREY